MYKVLNLYAGIGGNRKHWDKPLKEKFGDNYKITAIELNPEIAAIYQDFFPNDEVIVTDAHQYLLEHFKEFDFIWSSFPCQSHSRARLWGWKNDIRVKDVYPDLGLYQEIIFLNEFFKGKFVTENVKPYYEPLINPSFKLGRHLFWSNFKVNKTEFKEADIYRGLIKDYQKLHGIDISNYKINQRKDQILRNCVHPDTGLHILNRALEIQTEEKTEQFKLNF